MGTATLGFAGGPAIQFRIDPENIEWNWQVLTNVVETIGGRVIQVIGAYLDDLTVEGSLGQDHSTPDGESWRQAKAFLQLVTQIMDHQSRDSRNQAEMHPPAIFTYPPKNWRFRVYVKSLTDAEGNASVVLSYGKFNQRYILKLFIVQDASDALVKAGTTNGVFSQKAYDAIAAYMARISDGIGWHFSQYNGQAAGKWALKLGGTGGGTQSGGGGPAPGGNPNPPPPPPPPPTAPTAGYYVAVDNSGQFFVVFFAVSHADAVTQSSGHNAHLAIDHQYATQQEADNAANGFGIPVYNGWNAVPVKGPKP